MPATELAGSRVRIRIRRRDTIGKDVRDGWVDRNAPGGARPRRGGSTSWLRDPGATARPGRPIGSLLPTRGTRSRRRVRCTRRSHRARWCARRCCTPHEPRALRATTSDTVAVGVMSMRETTPSLDTAKSPRIAYSTMSHFFAALHFVKHTIKLFGINSKYVIITPNTKCPGRDISGWRLETLNEKTINTSPVEPRRPLSAAPLTRGVGSKTGNMPTHVSTPHTPPSASPSTLCAPFLAGHPTRRARYFFTHARRDR